MDHFENAVRSIYEFLNKPFQQSLSGSFSCNLISTISFFGLKERLKTSTFTIFASVAAAASLQQNNLCLLKSGVDPLTRFLLQSKLPRLCLHVTLITNLYLNLTLP